MVASLLISCAITSGFKEMNIKVRTDVMFSRKQDMLNSGIMEPEEVSRYFVNQRDLEEDWGIMVNRMKQMEPDCPLSVEAIRLPNRTLAWNCYREARMFLDWLEYVKFFYPPEVINTIIADTTWRKEVWGLIADASVEGAVYSHDGRRLILQRLRSIMGKENYENSVWPDPLPDVAYSGLWRWWEWWIVND